MEVSEEAMNIISQDVTPNSGLAEGIRLSQGSGCCGPAFELGLVKQSHADDIHQIINGINFYIDKSLEQYKDKITLDFQDGFFLVKGMAETKDCC